MRDGRWTFFIFVNNVLLAFYIVYLLNIFSASAFESGAGIPLLNELYMYFPPVAGIVNGLFNRSVIRHHYKAGETLSPLKKTWQWVIALFYLVAAVLIILQLSTALQYFGKNGSHRDLKLIIFLRVLLLLHSILAVYMLAFQLIAARNAGSTAESSSEATAEEISGEEEQD